MSRQAQPGPKVTTPMRTWIERLDWKYIGDCGCRSNKNKFVNPTYPNTEIWVTPAGDRMEFRKTYGRDSKIKAIGGTANFQMLYDYWIVSNNINV